MGNFAIQVRAFAEKAEGNANLVVRKIAIDMLSRVVQRSPVGNPELWAANRIAAQYNNEVNVENARLRSDPSNLTKAGRLKRGKKIKDSMKVKAPPGYVGGRFRANWIVTVGQPTTEIVDGVDPSGAKAISSGQASLANFELGHSIFLQNNLPYGPRLEYDSWSKQAPAGMVRITVAEFQQIVSVAVNEVRQL